MILVKVRHLINNFSFLKIIITKWHFLIGDEENFNLEARIFHSCVAYACILTSFFVVYNTFIASYISTFFAFVYLVFASCILYFSRFKGKVLQCQLLNIIVSFVIISLSFLTNDGVNGPTIILFLIFLALLAGYMPRKYYVPVIALNFFLVMLVQGIQLRFPHVLIYTYRNQLERHLDIYIVYVFCAITCFAAIHLLRKNYYQEVLKVSEKNELLNQANLEKNKLFSILAHDLTGPISHIKYYLEVLTKLEIDDKMRAEIQRDLYTSTQSTHQLLTNLLAWSKSYFQNTVPLNMGSVDLSKSISTILNSLQHTASLKNIRIESNCMPDTIVRADEMYVDFVLRNLLHNSIKFTPDSGRVSIKVIHQNEKAVIAISDNGIGIPADKQSSIFSFKALSTFGTNSEKGVGLGLMLCKEFMVLQEGSIWFESKEGSGSTFYVSFNLYQASANEAER